jgi:hypothetical protein
VVFNEIQVYYFYTTALTVLSELTQGDINFTGFKQDKALSVSEHKP